MKSRIIPGLQRYLIAGKYRDDADARAARASGEPVRRSVEELRGMGLRPGDEPYRNGPKSLLP